MLWLLYSTFIILIPALTNWFTKNCTIFIYFPLEIPSYFGYLLEHGEQQLLRANIVL